MWQKRQRSRDANAPPAKRLRDHLVDLYGTGAVPADTVQELFDDAGAYADEGGRDDFQDLRGSAYEGGQRNAARDLRRKLMRRSQWPPLYEAMIRTWVRKDKALQEKKVAFLLPHELVFVLSEIGDAATMQSTAGLDKWNLKRHEEIYAQLQKPFLSLSLWGDGVPYSWDRKRSVDTWTLSFPGLADKKQRDIRIVLVTLPHECVVRETQDDVLSLLCWSLKCLAFGLCPSARHDGSPWEQGDTWRKARAGQEVMNAALLEVKGDWKQMAFCFSTPSWTSGPDKPICWRCHATKQSLKEDFGPTAFWLQPAGRVSHHEAITRLLEAGGSLSPLWSMPWMKMSALRLDWLHIADQGITPVFLGGVFSLVLADKEKGANEAERCKWLWSEVQAFYRRDGVEDRLYELTVNMIKPKKGPIELAGSGAQVKSLVPFGLELVNSWVEPDWEQMSVKACMQHLAACYTCLRSAQPVQGGGELLNHALGFQRNLQGLHLANPKRWQIRPKLHLFLELAAEGDRPSASWNYREESFGGSVGKQSHRKGGWPSPLAMSRSTLTKFCARERLPALK